MLEPVGWTPCTHFYKITDNITSACITKRCDILKKDYKQIFFKYLYVICDRILFAHVLKLQWDEYLKKIYIAIFFVAKKWRWQSIVEQVLSHKLISSLKRRSLNYLFYNDYETSYTTYINHARWHRCLRSGGPRAGENRSTWRKPTCLTCGLTISHANARYWTWVATVRGEHYASQTATCI